MADIRCSSCGRNNPDFLDVCQFCQSPLKPEAMVQPGQSPTKKTTGELEPILPEWLRDVRQQARESVEEEAAQTATRSKSEEEAPDLLAGLAVQATSSEEEVPDWLAGLGLAEEKETSEEESPLDFFAQFEQKESSAEAAVEETPAWMKDEGASSEEKEELTDWFAQTSSEHVSPFDLDTLRGDEEAGGFDSTEASSEPSAAEEPEDLSWLRDLEASAKKSSAPSFEEPAPTAAPSSEDDLSWLSNLGGATESSFEEATPAMPSSSDEDLSWLSNLGGVPASTEPQSSDEDLSWLNNLGGVPLPTTEESVPAFEEPAPTIPPSSAEDLSWLDNISAPFVPASEEPAPTIPPSSQEDLSWLSNFGGVEAPREETPSAQPVEAQGDLDWLKNFEEKAETPSADESQPQFTPRRTAPLSEDQKQEFIPDWLKSVTEEPSMPPPGAASLDWFEAHDQKTEASESEPAVQTPEEPAPVESDIFSSVSESAPLTSQDLDSMFSVEMPDWLSGEPAEAAETSSREAAPFVHEEGEALAPVDLPSWVQAMRPVESVIEETAASSADQIVEKEGPLAGLRGVIPSAPIGSSRRPKAVSLKLQTTDEQQAGAALLEQILASETTARAIKSAPLLASQRMLRLVLTGAFLLVLTLTIAFGSQTMPVSAALPAGLLSVSSAVAGLPENASVLVVLDYEPSLAGEMEAVSGPLLHQMASARRPVFTFLSTSPNGSALVGRLLSNTGIAASDDQSGAQYFNIGFLPGGSAGVLGFVENPRMAMPAVNVSAFSDFAAVVVLTDHPESSRVWVEQLQITPALAGQTLLIAASAQAGPLLQPYVSSGQVDGMISGLADAARYEYVNNNSRPGLARSYWDAFGVGLMMAIALIVFGSLWNLFTNLRERRAEAEQG